MEPLCGIFASAKMRKSAGKICYAVFFQVRTDLKAEEELIANPSTD